MGQPIRIFYWEGLGFFVLLAVTLGWKLAGELKGLLRDAAGLQLMVVTAVVAGRYGWALAGQVVGADGGLMPAVGGWWLALFGLSGGLYGALRALRRMREDGRGVWM